MKALENIVQVVYETVLKLQTCFEPPRLKRAWTVSSSKLWFM